MEPLDDIDRSILLELQRDGRLTNQELADRVGLSPSPCLRRVRLLQERGVITRYTAVVSQAAVGLPITALVSLSLVSHAANVTEEVEARIRATPAIVEAHILAGDADYLLKVVVGSFEEFEAFVRRELRTLPSLASIRTTFAYGVTKEPSPLPVP